MDEEAAHMDLMVEDLKTDKLESALVLPRTGEEVFTPPSQIFRTC